MKQKKLDSNSVKLFKLKIIFNPSTFTSHKVYIVGTYFNGTISVLTGSACKKEIPFAGYLMLSKC
jgi:hypothetical protein